jgi:hypothetical protein
VNKHERIEADFLQAAGLLEADLVWSADFNSLRKPLADYLRSMAVVGSGNHHALQQLVANLLEEENNLTGE